MPLKDMKSDLRLLLKQVRSSPPSKFKSTRTFEDCVGRVKRTEPDMRKMFKEAGLRIDDPVSWYVLLGYFSDAFFGQPVNGRRTEWHDEDLAALRDAFVEEWSRDAQKSGTEVAKAIAKSEISTLKKHGSVRARLNSAGYSMKDLRREAIKKKARALGAKD